MKNNKKAMKRAKATAAKHQKVINAMRTHPSWPTHSPRKHQVPEGYYDPAWYQSNELLRVDSQKQYTEDGTVVYEGESIYNEGYDYHSDITVKVHGGLAQCMYPHYFVDKDLMRLLQMTCIADTVDMQKVRYPFNACLFSLPVGYLIENGEVVTHLSYYRSFDVQPLTLQLRAKERAEHSEEGRLYFPSFSIAWAKTLSMDEDKRELRQAELLGEIEAKWKMPCRVIPTFSVMALYDTDQLAVCSYPVKSSSFGDILQMFEDNYTVDGFVTPASPITTDSQDAGVKSLQDLTRLVVTLILYMGSRPKEWDIAQTKSKPKGKSKLKQTPETYSPNFLGKKYSGSTKATPTRSTGLKRLKPHWRSGYMGIRWYGVGRTEARQVWTEPYPVNIEIAA